MSQIRSARVGLSVLLVAGFVLGLPRPAAAGDGVPLIAAYHGEFTLLFGAGAGGTDELSFSGDGLAFPFGASEVDGYTLLLPTAPGSLVSDIVYDEVTLTMANGDEVYLVNSGQDTVDLSIPGRTFIRGSGTFVVAGFSGRHREVTAGGTYAVLAEVTGGVEGGVTGYFYLVFVRQYFRVGR